MISFSKICFSSKRFSGHVECKFDNPAKMVFGFFLKRWVFEIKTWFIFKIGERGNIAVECVSSDFISWKCLLLWVWHFAIYSESFEFWKNTFLCSKSIFNKNDGRKVMPLLDGPLIFQTIFLLFSLKIYMKELNPVGLEKIKFQHKEKWFFFEFFGYLSIWGSQNDFSSRSKFDVKMQCLDPENLG